MATANAAVASESFSSTSFLFSNIFLRYFDSLDAFIHDLRPQRCIMYCVGYVKTEKIRLPERFASSFSSSFSAYPLPNSLPFPFLLWPQISFYPSVCLFLTLDFLLRDFSCPQKEEFFLLTLQSRKRSGDKSWDFAAVVVSFRSARPPAAELLRWALQMAVECSIFSSIFCSLFLPR